MAVIDASKQRLLHEEQERQIKRRLAVKGWEDNVVTRYLLQLNVSPCKMASIMDVHRSVVSRWLHLKDNELTPFVHWAFLTFAKLKLMGVSVENCF